MQCSMTARHQEGSQHIRRRRYSLSPTTPGAAYLVQGNSDVDKGQKDQYSGRSYENAAVFRLGALLAFLQRVRTKKASPSAKKVRALPNERTQRSRKPYTQCFFKLDRGIALSGGCNSRRFMIEGPGGRIFPQEKGEQAAPVKGHAGAMPGKAPHCP